MSHTWDKRNAYTIRAKDIFDEKSYWGTLTITIPKNKPSCYSSLFMRFLEKFQLLQRLLQI